MHKDEINKIIAEFCGWKNIRELDYQPIGTDPYIDGPSQVWVGIHPESDVDSKEYEVIPDYCNDLNAMHEVVEMLKGDDDIKYVNYLFASVGINRYYYMGATPEAFPADRQMKVINASALQRAEAFLRTIDKWEE